MSIDDNSGILMSISKKCLYFFENLYFSIKKRDFFTKNRQKWVFFHICECYLSVNFFPKCNFFSIKKSFKKMYHKISFPHEK